MQRKKQAFCNLCFEVCQHCEKCNNERRRAQTSLWLLLLILCLSQRWRRWRAGRFDCAPGCMTHVSFHPSFNDWCANLRSHSLTGCLSLVSLPAAAGGFTAANRWEERSNPALVSSMFLQSETAAWGLHCRDKHKHTTKPTPVCHNTCTQSSPPLEKKAHFC